MKARAVHCRVSPIISIAAWMVVCIGMLVSTASGQLSVVNGTFDNDSNILSNLGTAGDGSAGNWGTGGLGGRESRRLPVRNGWQQ